MPLKTQRALVQEFGAIQGDVAEAKQLLAAKSTLLDRLEQSILERAFRGEL